MAHWLDIGGILGGMSTDIFSEGLQIPILKYQDRGVINQTWSTSSGRTCACRAGQWAICALRSPR